MAKICVPVCGSGLNELATAVAQASEVADIIELRLDCVDKEALAEVLQHYPGWRESARLPFIITFRPAEQGGRRSLSAHERIEFWSKFSRATELGPPDYADLEAELLLEESSRTEPWLSQLASQRLICSHHDFAGVPSDLNALYEQMATIRDVVIKIAVRADDITDCIPIFKLLDRAKREGREMIAIAMGKPGLMTRVLGPARGSFLTYAALEDERGTAAGQITARELRNLYRIDQIDSQTKIFGIIGSPVSHSWSPHIHNPSFAAANLNAVYLPFEVHDVSQFMQRMAHPKSRELDWNLRGLSITAPHKARVMKYLDWVDPTAKEIGAVNTIVAQEDQLFGYNTDVIGFIEPLKRALGSLRGIQCAIIGAGGAARACLWSLGREGARTTLLARTPDRAEALALEFGAECRALAGARCDHFDVVINATPAGTRGELQNQTPVTTSQLRGVRLAYDLVYNPVETQFLLEASAAGCEVLGGVEMLLRQAVEQFRLWTGLDPDDTVMRRAVCER